MNFYGDITTVIRNIKMLHYLISEKPTKCLKPINKFEVQRGLDKIFQEGNSHEIKTVAIFFCILKM